MNGNIKRHFVTLEGRWGKRQVHYRRSGQGPLLLLLHQSPQSSRELEPLMALWETEFTVIAPDSPGYGLSDPLDVEQATLSEFADATIEFMDAIGARRFGVYGFHTGGMIGVALAHGHPQRIASFVCNGIAVLNAAEREDILAHYLPPFEPRWDGGHLAWLWGRNREQTIFFPWHNRTLAGRMDFTMPPVPAQQSGVCEFLRAGDHYRVGYRAAFTFASEQVVAQLTVPGLITAMNGDPLQSHLQRLDDVPASVTVMSSETIEEALERSRTVLLENPGDALSAAPPTQPIEGRLWREIVLTDSEPFTVSVRRGGDADAKPVLLIHGPGGSSATLTEYAACLSASRSVIAIDLPGHGETDAGTLTVTLASCADSVSAVMDRLEIHSADVVAVEGGAYVAAELVRRAADKVARLVLIQPSVVPDADRNDWREAGLPSCAPQWSGGHLLTCWHMVRDGRLYFPWFRREQSAIRWQEPELDEQRIQLEVTGYLIADGYWQGLLNEQLDYPLAESLRDWGGTLRVAGSPTSPWFATAQELADHWQVPFIDLGADQRQWARKLSAALADHLADPLADSLAD